MRSMRRRTRFLKSARRRPGLSMPGMRLPSARRWTRPITRCWYVAGRASRSLLVYDRTTHQLTSSVPLSFDPGIIDPFGPNGFLLTHRSAGTDPLWSFTNSAQPAVYFVPATPVSEPRRRFRNDLA